MKNMIVVICLLIAGIASGQTNALIFISFTNSSGVFVTNAQVVKVYPNKLIYATDVGGGTIRLDKLPSVIRKSLGYNPTNAAAADAAEAAKKTNVGLTGLIAQQTAAAHSRRELAEETVYATGWVGYGDIIQKIPQGLLVMTPGHASEDGADQTTIFLKGYSGASLAADDFIKFTAFPVGTYSYITALRTQNTVHAYTCDLAAATDYYLTNRPDHY
jgi:hypothetical protein